MDLRSIPLEALREPGYTSRSDVGEEGIRELAQSIQAEGLLHPLHVRGLAEGVWEVVAGHRRLLALRLLRWPSVPCFVLGGDLDPELVKVHENLHRRDLNPYEESVAVERMHREGGLSFEQIAVACSRSPSWVLERLRFRGFPVGLQEMVRDGDLSLAVAKVLAKITDPVSLEYYAGEAARNGVTERVARLWVMQYEQSGPVQRVETEEGFVAAEDPPPVDPLIECVLGGHHVPLSHSVVVRACSECAAELRRVSLGEVSG